MTSWRGEGNENEGNGGNGNEKKGGKCMAHNYATLGVMFEGATLTHLSPDQPQRTSLFGVGSCRDNLKWMCGSMLKPERSRTGRTPGKLRSLAHHPLPHLPHSLSHTLPGPTEQLSSPTNHTSQASKVGAPVPKEEIPTQKCLTFSPSKNSRSASLSRSSIQRKAPQQR